MYIIIITIIKLVALAISKLSENSGRTEINTQKSISFHVSAFLERCLALILIFQNSHEINSKCRTGKIGISFLCYQKLLTIFK